MWNSKDLALVIVIAVVSFVYSVLIGQLGAIFTGIQGFNYLFYVGHALFISLGLLLYKGRRWRFFLQTVLVALLSLPVSQFGAPYDVMARIPVVLNGIFLDLLFNSLYQYFQKREKLLLWSLLISLVGVFTCLVFISLNFILFISMEALNSFMNLFFMLSPIKVIEGLVGGYLAFQISERLKKMNT